MSGLQRSQISFRRQGSSGMVWDDKFLNSLQDGVEREQQEQSINSSSSSQQETAITKTQSEQKPNEAENNSVPASEKKIAIELRRSKSEQRATAYRAVKVINDEDPPSPRVSSCGFCFGKKSASKQKGAAKSSAGSASDKKKIGRKV